MSICCTNCTTKKEGFFCSLSPAITSIINSNKKTKKFKKGEIIYLEGQVGEGIYCIQTGKIKMVRKDGNGKDAIINIQGHGELVGHLHLFQSDHYIATATAIEDCQACFIERAVITKAIEDHSELAIHFIKHLSQELSNYDFKLTSFVSKNVKSRLADLLLQMGIKFGTQLHEGLRIDVKLTREELASIIGTVNETVTRFMTEFKDCGYIMEKEKTLYILQPGKLKEIANN